MPKIKDLSYYKECFIHLNRSSRKGEKAPHKPVLLLAVIDRVENLISMGISGGRMINQNLIDLNPKLEQFFYNNWNTYVVSETFSPSFATPFFHMEAEPFWNLVLKKNAIPQGSQGEAHLYRYYIGAQIDEDLMLLLLEDDARNELRQLLIDILTSKPLGHSSPSDILPFPQVSMRTEKIPSDEDMCLLFQKFMRENGTSENSVKKYSIQVSRNADVRSIVETISGKDSLFKVTSLDDANAIRSAVKASPCDIKGNHMYSVGISHYIKFLSAWLESRNVNRNDRGERDFKDFVENSVGTDAIVIFEHSLDYSFYNYGCTIDKKFHQSIFDALGGRLERGQRANIVVSYDNKQFSARFENVDRHGVASDTIRCMWMGKSDDKLSTYLQAKFPESQTIADLHERKERVPINLLHNATLHHHDGVNFVLIIS